MLFSKCATALRLIVRSATAEIEKLEKPDVAREYFVRCRTPRSRFVRRCVVLNLVIQYCRVDSPFDFFFVRPGRASSRSGEPEHCSVWVPTRRQARRSFRTLSYSSHSMRAAGHSFRNAGRFAHSSSGPHSSWKNRSNNPALRWVWSTLFWLPTLTVFTQVGCTIRAVTGDSMQVRGRTNNSLCLLAYNKKTPA